MASRPLPAKPPASPSPPVDRGASTTAADVPPSELNHISGEILRPSTPPRGTDELPYGVELSEDMQDPAAFVDTPLPEGSVVVAPTAQSTPTPISPTPQPVEPTTERLRVFGSVPPEDVSVDVDEPRPRSGKPRTQRGLADWPMVVHVLLGVVLGAAIVAAYSAYYGLPLPLP